MTGKKSHRVDRDALLSSVDIVEIIDSRVPLKKAGKDYVAPCPFHGETNASFTVSKRKQFYHCFGCGEHGNAIDFVMAYDGVDFTKALAILGGDSHALPQDPKEIERIQAEHKRKRDLDLAKDKEQKWISTQRSRKLWPLQKRARSTSLPPQSYLADKQIKPIGVRYTKGDGLAVPAWDLKTRQLLTIQWIFPNGEKRFSDDSPVLKSCAIVGELREQAEVLYITEGYATAVSAFMATGVPTLAAWNSANLANIAKQAWVLFPDARIVLLADEDQWPNKHGKIDNVGRKKALEAAAMVGGAVRFPVFADVSSKPTDFNDLHCLEGLDRVAEIILTPDPELDSPKAPEPENVVNLPVPAVDLSDIIERTKTDPGYPYEGPVLQALSQIRDTDLPEWQRLRARLKAANVKISDLELALPKPKNGLTHAAVPEVGAVLSPPQPDPKEQRLLLQKLNQHINILFEFFVYVHGIKPAIWDGLHCRLMTVDSLKSTAPTLAPVWLESDNRKIIDQSDIVFDPKLEHDQSTVINLFRGFDLKPADSADKAKLIIEHLLFLCGGRADVADWVTKFLAFPLQNVGTKMETALVIHGEDEGTGKNLFFEKVMGRIYGQYFAPIGQSQLDSDYTGWASGKLFVFANEVIAPHDKRALRGRLKQLISDDTVWVVEKWLTDRQETNHMTWVFASNENSPVLMSTKDRRHMVVHCRDVKDRSYYDALGACIRNGGIAAFYRYLLDYPLGDFDNRTKPINTSDRDAIIEVSMESDEAFIRAWMEGDDERLPFVVICLSADLFLRYQTWCQENGLRYKHSRAAFMQTLTRVSNGAIEFGSTQRFQFLSESDDQVLYDSTSGPMALREKTAKVVRTVDAYRYSKEELQVEAVRFQRITRSLAIKYGLTRR